VGERDDTRREVEQKRERMSQIAHEVSRRMTPRYAKERAREMARERMGRARDRAVESSWFSPVLGAGVGALLAKALQSRAQERRWEAGDDRWDGRRARWEVEETRYGYGYGRDAGYAPYDVEYRGDVRARDEAMHAGMGADGEAEGLRAKASQATSQVGEKLSGMAESARHRADEVKDRLHDATSTMRERLPDRERIRTSTREDTGFWALGALALGALFGFALPETRRERELLEPARRKARELGQEARDMALEKGSEMMDKATEKVRSADGEQEKDAQGASAPGMTPTGSPEPLH
jgi:ElaB/YqjD/DUF883 family membrane-anchored ribosome-binding protein